MAEKVRITKGAGELTVSRKAFEAVYKAKGFRLVGEAQSDSDASASLAAGEESSLVGDNVVRLSDVSSGQVTAPPAALAKAKHKGGAKPRGKAKGGAKAESAGSTDNGEGKAQI